MTSDEKRIVQSVFEKTYECYYESICKFCLSRLEGGRETAHDCTQEVFLVFYNRLMKGETFENPRAFLYRTAVNLIYKFNASHIKMKTNEVEINENISDEGLSAADDKLQLEIIYQRIEEALSEEELHLFKLYFNEEQKVKDIAAQLHISPGTCATRLYRLRQKLQQVLTPYYNENL